MKGFTIYLSIIFLVITGCSGGGNDVSTGTGGSSGGPVTDSNLNTAPVLTSPHSIQIMEGQHKLNPLEAMDKEDDYLVFSLVDGEDKSHFTLLSEGNLTFNNIPDYETPLDANADNSYQITVRISDGKLSSDANLTVKVTDALEDGANYGQVTIEGYPVVDRTLAAVVTDNDGLDGVNINYQWQRIEDGASRAVGNDASYLLTKEDIGSTIRVIATYTDNQGYSNVVQSDDSNVVVDMHIINKTVPVADAIQGKIVFKLSHLDESGDADYVLKDISPQAMIDVVDKMLPTEEEYNEEYPEGKERETHFFGYPHIQALYPLLSSPNMFEISDGDIVLRKKQPKILTHVGTSKDKVEIGTSYSLALFKGGKLDAILNMRMTPDKTATSGICDRYSYTERTDFSENPVVLVHGWSVSGRYKTLDIHSWPTIAEKLEETGAEVFIAEVDAWNTSESRGEQLISYIECVLDETRTTKSNPKVDIIGHSHGGPTSRYAAHWLGESKVNSVTTAAGINQGGIADIVHKEQMDRAIQKNARHYQFTGAQLMYYSLDELIFKIINKDNLEITSTVLGEQYDVVIDLLGSVISSLENIDKLLEGNSQFLDGWYRMSQQLTVSFFRDHVPERILWWIEPLCGQRIDPPPGWTYEWIRAMQMQEPCRGSIGDRLALSTKGLKSLLTIIKDNQQGIESSIEQIKGQLESIKFELDKLSTDGEPNFYQIASNVDNIIEGLRAHHFQLLYEQFQFTENAHSNDFEHYDTVTFLDGLHHIGAFRSTLETFFGVSSSEDNPGTLEKISCHAKLIEYHIAETRESKPDCGDGDWADPSGLITYHTFITVFVKLPLDFYDALTLLPNLILGALEAVLHAMFSADYIDFVKSFFQGPLDQLLQGHVFHGYLELLRGIEQSTSKLIETSDQLRENLRATAGDDYKGASWSELMNWEKQRFEELKRELITDFLNSEVAEENSLSPGDSDHIYNCLFSAEGWYSNYSKGYDPDDPQLPEDDNSGCLTLITTLANAVVDEIYPLEQPNPITGHSTDYHASSGIYGLSSFGSQLFNLKYTDTGLTPGAYQECMSDISKEVSASSIFEKSDQFNSDRQGKIKYYSLIGSRDDMIGEGRRQDIIFTNIVTAANNTDLRDAYNSFVEYYASLRSVIRYNDLSGEPKLDDLKEVFAHSDGMVHICSQQLGRVSNDQDGQPNQAPYPFNHSQILNHDGMPIVEVLVEDLIDAKREECNRIREDINQDGKTDILDRKQCLVELFPKIQVLNMVHSQKKTLRDSLSSVKKWLGPDHRPGLRVDEETTYDVPQIYYDHLSRVQFGSY
ncbi:MAG: alpha/beta fold hydrolase [Porticoccaceae bacterium]